jgi:pimeloyl-ACP methyl ester carboxylesterase
MSMWRSQVRLLLVAVTALSVCCNAVVAPVSAAPTQPKIAWSPCYRSFGFPFECATVQVPLDYNNPGTAAISLAVIRLPASDPARRIGSLFINPGGPGGSGFDFALFAGPFLYTDEVRARFDIVGFDPRGINRSTALRCFGTVQQAIATFAPFPFPTTSDEQAIWEASDRALVAACDQRAGRIRDHMSTADVARDLDVLRQAVGDAGLTYAGVSYGTYLGVTYANLFPDKVRAVVVDGVLDPVAWATGRGNEAATLPFSTRLRSDAGALATLNEFFRLCDAGGANCAFSGNAAARFAALANRLRTAPLAVTLPDGTTFNFTYADLIANALGAMYDSSSWPDFAQFLAAIEALASPSTLGVRLQAYWERAGYVTKRGFPHYTNFAEGFPGVACADTDNPTSYAAWSAAAADAEARFGYFGPLWTWITSVCVPWRGPSAGRYAGPFTSRTANPVLVIGNIYDPATRYQGAVTVSQLLPNSRLLTLHGWGHTSLFLSQCIDAAVSRYLVDGITPAAGTVCEQDVVPFTQPSAAAAASSPRARVNGVLVPDAVRKSVR